MAFLAKIGFFAFRISIYTLLNRCSCRRVLIAFLAGLAFSTDASFGALSNASAQGYALPYYVEQVANIAPGNQSSNPGWFTVVDNELYFQADDARRGIELWRYSPQTGETSIVSDIYKGSGSSNPEWLTVYGRSIYFAATDAVNGRQIWKHDTSTGTTRLLVNHENLPQGSDPKWLQFMGPVLFYTAKARTVRGTELYAVDVRDGRSWLVKDINAGSASSTPEFLFVRGATLYFTADDGLHGKELWRSDGTEAGTTMIADIWPGAKGSSPASFNMLGEQFVFSADHFKYGRELWRSYGTEESTVMIKDIYDGKTASDPGWSNRLGNSVVFFPAKTEELGNELWRYDQQYGAYLLDDVNPGDGDSNPAAIGSVGWTMFFSADDNQAGIELWKSEPPYGYAVQIADIYPGEKNSEPKSLGVLGTTLFFTANDGTHGAEVWATEFPYTVAQLLKDIKPGSAGSIKEFTYGDYTDTLSNATRIGWTIYFTANSGKSGVELWQISTGALPQTGFAPYVETEVAAMPPNLGYQTLDDFELVIAELGVQASLTGVPKIGNTWNVDWLASDEVGYLSGTAFPTLPGNTVISGHVYLSDGSPGPFHKLEDLAWGDEITINAWGQQYIYQVRDVNLWVDPNDRSILEHKDRDWITLITCKGYDDQNGYYRWRTAVQAVLVDIVDD